MAECAAFAEENMLYGSQLEPRDPRLCDLLSALYRVVALTLAGARARVRWWDGEGGVDGVDGGGDGGGGNVGRVCVRMSACVNVCRCVCACVRARARVCTSVRWCGGHDRVAVGGGAWWRCVGGRLVGVGG